MATLAEMVAELADVKAAIARITGTESEPGAQSYSTSNRSITRAPLETLLKMKRELERDIARNGGPTGTGATGMGSNPIFGPPRCGE